MKRVWVALFSLVAFAFVPVFTRGAGAGAITPSCTRLVVGTSTVEGTDGSGYLTILFANAGATCQLEGFPSVHFFEPNITHLVGHDVHRSSMVFASPGPRRIVLTRGKVASVGVTWNDDPKAGQGCPSTQWLNVVLPGPNRENYQPSLNAKPCGTALWVTPFESGAQPEFVWNAPPS
jgi:hypothetical protein